MISLAVSFAAGAIFGIALAAPPGPMNAIIAEESVFRGWLAGFRAGLGAMTADLLFMFLSLVGVVAIVDQVPALRTAMIFIGGLLMCYFAYEAFTEARGSFTDAAELDDDSRGFRRAFVLALTNPYQVIFWLTIGIGLLQDGQLDLAAHAPILGELTGTGSIIVQTGSPALLIGFFGGILIWVTAYPAVVVAAGDRIDAAAPLIAVLSGLVLAGFGIGFLFDAITTIL